MKTIIISGKQGSGKSSIQNELASALYQRHKCSTARINFADPLYEIHDFMVSRLSYYGVIKEYKKHGEFLQYLGTDFGRKNFGDNVWVNIAKNRIDNHKSLGTRYVIIGDCRFENEFDNINALKIRLICRESVRKDRCPSWRDNTNHKSETDLDKYEVENKFDMMFNTEFESVNHCVEMIIAKLLSEK